MSRPSAVRAAFLGLILASYVPVLPAAQEKEPPRGQEPVRLDRTGDPLPPAALHRLGTTRLRHGGAVMDLAFSPDGKLLAAVGGSNDIHFWEVPTGKLVCTIPGHKWTVRSVAFSPDGKTLAAGSGVHTILLFDVASGKETARFEGKEKEQGGERLTFSPDGSLLCWVVGLNQQALVIHDLATGQQIKRLEDGKGTIRSVQFAPNGRTVALAGYHRGAQIWEVASGKLRQQFDKNLGQVTAASFSPDGKALFVAGSQGVLAWDVATGKQLRQLSLGRHWAESIPVSSDGKLVAVADTESSIVLWDLTTGKEARRLSTPHRGRAGKIAFSPDGKSLASTGWADHQICFYDVVSGKPLSPSGGHASEVSGLAVSPDGKLIASAGRDGTLRLWEAATGKELRCFRCGPNQAATGAVFTPDGKSVLTATGLHQNDNYLSLWDVASGKEARRIGIGKKLDPISAIALAADGKTVATAGPGWIKLWDVTSGKQVSEIKYDRSRWISAIAFTPDGKRILSGHSDKVVVLWDVATGKEVRKVGAHDGSVFALAVSADGTRVASAAADDTARLWDLATGKELLRCSGHDNYAFAVALSPNGRLLVSTGRDHTIRLWETATGRELATVIGHQAMVRALTFSPDGKTLVSGSHDTSLLIWDVNRILDGGLLVVAKLSPKDLEELWQELQVEDAARGFRAMRTLIGAGKDAVKFLGEQLRQDVVPEQVTKLIKSLGADTFAEREKATAALAKLGSAVEPALRRALADQPPAEIRARLERLLAKLKSEKATAQADLRDLRAVEVLEEIGTAEAVAVLERLAREGPASRRGREASLALARMRKGGR
jgi:WD40 repeat protein